jgi:hypothetical protein
MLIVRPVSDLLEVFYRLSRSPEPNILEAVPQRSGTSRVLRNMEKLN